MKTIKFILKKIIIIEVMLIILFLISNLFGKYLPIITPIINIMLYYITPISVIALVIYMILSLLSIKLIEILINIVLGSIIIYYLINYWL